jgi:hypothetical protein
MSRCNIFWFTLMFSGVVRLLLHEHVTRLFIPPDGSPMSLDLSISSNRTFSFLSLKCHCASVNEIPILPILTSIPNVHNCRFWPCHLQAYSFTISHWIPYIFYIPQQLL